MGFLKDGTVPNDRFASAIEQALRGSGLFKSASVGHGSPDYALDVSIVAFDQSGFDITVTLTTRWQLTEVASGRVVLEQYIDTSNTVTAGQAFAGWTRARCAKEGAAQKNIAQGIEALSALHLGVDQ